MKKKPTRAFVRACKENRISQKTAIQIHQSMMNLKSGKVGKPVDLSPPKGFLDNINK